MKHKNMKYKKAHIFLVICVLTSLIMSTSCGSRSQINKAIGSASLSEENAYGVISQDLGTSNSREVSGGERTAADGTRMSGGEDNSADVSVSQEIDREEDTTSQVSIIMVGDILLHTPVAKSGIQEDGSYNFDSVFANVKEEIAAADLAIVNQEVIIGGEELGVSGYPCFNAPYELGDALADAGFDVVLHATNHALDKGSKGINNCISFWKNNYPQIAVLGINESEEEQENIYVYEKDGVKIAILNYTYGTNGIPLPEDMPYAVNMLEKEKVAEDIGKAKEAADFIIVCPHWGTEYKLTPSAEQEKWTEFLLENGVDLVIGTHPHVIEPIELVSDDNGNEMLVYYSLGNFVNWTSGRGEGVAARMVGGMAQVTVARNEDGEVGILDYGVEPLVCHLREGTNGVTTYFLSDYTQQMAEENMITAQDAEFSAEYCESLCREVWSGIFGTRSSHLFQSTQ